MAEFEQITRTSNGVKVLAPAKINLSLLVAGKRPDGFHEIETVMAKVTLFDELIIEHGKEPGIELVCIGSEWAPEGRDNLVYTACEKLFEVAGKSFPVKVTLEKNIPAGAGLGSASTDAAAVLLGLNELFELGLSIELLSELAGDLGSDVAFFFGGPLAFCTGRGEKIQKIGQEFNFSSALVLPRVSCLTAKVYANYRHDSKEYERLSEAIGAELAKNRIEIVSKMCANMLQTSCFELYTELAELKAQLGSLGTGHLCVSGSGCSMYHIFDSSEGGQAEDYLRRITEQTGCKCIIVTNNRW